MTTNFRPSEIWEPIKLVGSSSPMTARAANRSDSDTIVSGIGTSGNVNTVTLADVDSKIGSGTSLVNCNCAIFAIPLVDKYGNAITHNQSFNLRTFIKPTSTPGVEDNECFIGTILFDGNLDLDTAKLGMGLVWDNATGPKAFTISYSGGISEASANASTEYLSGYIPVNMPSLKYVSNTVTAWGVDSVGRRTTDRNSTGEHLYQGSGSPPTSRIITQAYVGLILGRASTGAGAKTFSFEAYYSVSGGAIYKNSRTTNPSN